MFDPIDRHKMVLVTDIIEDSAVAAPDAITASAAELLHAKWARLVSQKRKT